jgi:hypothetical protein
MPGEVRAAEGIPWPTAFLLMGAAAEAEFDRRIDYFVA